LLTILAAAHGQTFEVASVKPTPPPDGSGVITRWTGGPGTDDPALFTCENCGLASLIMSAYGLDSYQYSGPVWTNSMQFTVTAKIPEGATKDEFRRMQQNLLVERFRLKFHYEKKEMARYELAIAKNGPKLKESPETSAPTMSMAAENGGYTIHARQGSMEYFVSLLSAQLRRPITDATELKGKYDMTLHWIPDASSDGPTIFEALQQQLGLKLEQRKTTVDVLVVDHVEKVPTEN
jgi:uncharacterized protein (TIGR03435 family)